MQQATVSVLGPVSVRVGETSIPVSGKPGAVLAMLALDAGRPVSLDRLIDGVWGEDSPRTVRTSLQVQIWRLRSIFAELGMEDVIVTASPGYLLDASAVTVDAVRFAELSGDARTQLGAGDAASSAHLARAALDEFQQEPLGSIGDPPFAAPVRTRLADQRLDTVELWADAEMACGRGEDVITAMERWIEQVPYRESLWQRLILALYRRGRQVDALERLAGLRRMLSEELGVRPCAAIVDLESSILDQDPSLQLTTTAAAVPARLSGPGRRLPAARELVGRDALVAHVVAQFDHARLVTLVGSGGVGKTSVAVNAATGLTANHADGAWFVDLSRVADDSLVLTALGTAFGLHAGEGGLVIDALVELLADAELLLVVDNCEHVVGSVATIVDEIVRNCPHVDVLATSRERLVLGDEVVVDVPPLDRDDAVELLGHRARRAGAVVRDDERDALAALCEAVDRLPLGLELVAARLPAMSATDIVRQLDAGQLLQVAGRGSHVRQRSLHSAIQWSVDLLAEPARALLRRLSVFEGGAELDAILAVCADPNGGVQRESVSVLLDELVRASLVHIERSSARNRYSLLRTVRAFGDEQLVDPERTTVRSRHVDEMIALGRRVREISEGPDSAAAYASIVAEAANLRAAHRYSVETGDVHRAAAMIGAPGAVPLRESGAVHELDEWIDDALVADGLTSEERLGLLLVGAFRSGRSHSVALAWSEEAIDLAAEIGDDAAGAFAEFLLGDGLLDVAPEEAEAHLRSALAKLEALGRLRGAGQAVNSLVNLLLRQHRFEDVGAVLDPRLEVATRYGSSEPLLRYNHARRLMMQGDYDGARVAFDETMTSAVRCGTLVASSYAWYGSATLAETVGDAAAARNGYERCLVLDIQSGGRYEILATRTRIAVMCARLGDADGLRDQHAAISTLAALSPGPREIGCRELCAGLRATLEGDTVRATTALLDALDAFAPTQITNYFLDVLDAFERVVPEADSGRLRTLAEDLRQRRRTAQEVAVLVRDLL